MQISAAINRYGNSRIQVAGGLSSLTLARKLLLALAMAAATGLMAQVRLPLSWTPVPVTGQVLAVLLAAVVLGGRFGALSQVLYLTLGAAGVPWFNGFTSGIGILAGPTGGYLLGFVPAAFVVGRMVGGRRDCRTLPRLFTLMASSVVLLIYLPGMTQLAFWARSVTGSFPTFQQLMIAGAVPFLPGTALKVFYAGLFARAIHPPYLPDGDGIGSCE